MTQQYISIDVRSGEVDTHGVFYGPGVSVHDVYRDGGVLFITLKVPAHKRFGGQGMSRINEPGRLLTFKVHAVINTTNHRGAVIGTRLTVAQVSTAPLRAWGDKQKMAEAVLTEVGRW